jgi:hypothetical protein
LNSPKTIAGIETEQNQKTNKRMNNKTRRKNEKFKSVFAERKTWILIKKSKTLYITDNDPEKRKSRESEKL